jgi:hypothetical protein
MQVKFYRTVTEAIDALRRLPSRLRFGSFPVLITVFPVCTHLHKTFTLLSQRSAPKGQPLRIDLADCSSSALVNAGQHETFAFAKAVPLSLTVRRSRRSK